MATDTGPTSADAEVGTEEIALTVVTVETAETAEAETEESTDGGVTRGIDADRHPSTDREGAAEAIPGTTRDARDVASAASSGVISRQIAQREEEYKETAGTYVIATTEAIAEETTAWVATVADHKVRPVTPRPAATFRGVARRQGNAEASATTRTGRPHATGRTTVRGAAVPRVVKSVTTAEAPLTTTCE